PDPSRGRNTPHHKHSRAESANAAPSPVLPLTVAAVLGAGFGHGHEGDAGVVLVALAGLTGPDALGQGLCGLGVPLVAVEHDRFLLDVVGGGDADLGPSLVLQGVPPGAGQAVDPAG